MCWLRGRQEDWETRSTIIMTNASSLHRERRLTVGQKLPGDISGGLPPSSCHSRNSSQLVPIRHSYTKALSMERSSVRFLMSIGSTLVGRLSPFDMCCAAGAFQLVGGCLAGTTQEVGIETVVELNHVGHIYSVVDWQLVEFQPRNALAAVGFFSRRFC